MVYSLAWTPAMAGIWNAGNPKEQINVLDRRS